MEGKGGEVVTRQPYRKVRLDHLLSRETRTCPEGSSESSPAWKQQQSLSGPVARVRLASSPAVSASGFRGSAPGGLRPPAHLDSCIAFGD